MTAHPETSIADLREAVVEGLQRAVDGLEGGYAAPLRRQLRAEGDVYNAAVLCLGLGRLAGEETRILPCSLTLGLLEEMGRIFLGLEDETKLGGGWGMPRTLNAADGLYTLAHHILLTNEALDTDVRLKTLGIFSDSAREFSEALHARAPQGDKALEKAAATLYPAAVDYAALCSGFSDELRSEVAAAAESGTIEAALAKASALPLRRT